MGFAGVIALLSVQLSLSAGPVAPAAAGWPAPVVAFPVPARVAAPPPSGPELAPSAPEPAAPPPVTAPAPSPPLPAPPLPAGAPPEVRMAPLDAPVRPIYRRWWFWTALGGFAGATALSAWLATRSGPEPRYGTLAPGVVPLP